MQSSTEPTTSSETSPETDVMSSLVTTTTNSEITPPTDKESDVLSVSGASCTSSPLALDPSQLVFRIGPSISPGKSDNLIRPIQTSPLASTSGSSAPVTSSSRQNIPNVFGNYIRKEANNMPRRFHFESTTSGDTATNASTNFTQQTKPFDTSTLPARYGSSGQPQRIFPNLSPEITIRRIHTRAAAATKTNETNTKKNPQQSRGPSNDVNKILESFNKLSREVASLKSQLAEKQTVIQEILGDFSSEMFDLNTRLTAIEDELGVRRCSNENVLTQEDLSSQLNDLSLTKAEEQDSD